jgi:hypothetical protein
MEATCTGTGQCEGSVTASTTRACSSTSRRPLSSVSGLASPAGGARGRAPSSPSNAKLYWQEQNIRLNSTRFAPTLDMVKGLLRE